MQLFLCNSSKETGSVIRLAYKKKTLQAPGDGEVGFCTQNTVHPYLALLSLVKPVNLWHLLSFYSHNNSHAVSDLGLISAEILKKISLISTEMHKAKISLVKICNFLKKFIIILIILSLPAYWLLKLEWAHPSGCSVKLVSVLHFLLTFHPPVCRRYSPWLLHKTQPLYVQPSLGSLGEVFPSPHASQRIH